MPHDAIVQERRQFISYVVTTHALSPLVRKTIEFIQIIISNTFECQ